VHCIHRREWWQVCAGDAASCQVTLDTVGPKTVGAHWRHLASTIEAMRLYVTLLWPFVFFVIAVVAVAGVAVNSRQFSGLRGPRHTNLNAGICFSAWPPLPCSALGIGCVTCVCAFTATFDLRQTVREAQLSPRDRAMRRVSWNIANCHAAVQKLLVRQHLNQVSAVANWPVRQKRDVDSAWRSVRINCDKLWWSSVGGRRVLST